MAEFWSNNDRGYRIRLWIDQVSQNIGANSSQVRIRLALLNGTTTFASYNCSAYVDVNGQRHSWTGRPSVLSNNSTLMLIDKTVTITHNADGKKSFALSARFSGSGGWSPGTLTIGGNSFTLSTIPRSSSVTVASGIIGSSVTININRQSSSFKHTVRYTWGSKSGTIASNVDTATTWTIPNDFANDIPNSISGTGTIYVDTYSGNTKTGTQSVSFRADVPSSMKPTFSNVTLTDTNGAAGNLLTGNNFLQIISNVQVTFNGASGSYSSSIVGYKAEIVNRNQVTTSNGGTLGIMNFNGSATIRASVIDSRGRQSDTRDITINVIEYFAPILSFTAVRTRETPSIIQIVRNAKIAPITLSGSQKNVMTLTFKVAPLGSTSYTADNGSATGTFTTQHTLTNSAANMAGNYPANKSFTVIGTLADKFTSIEFSATVATESVVMSYDKDGRVGVGKVVEQGKAGSLDVAGDIFAGGKMIQHHQLTTNDGYIVNDYYTDFNTNTKTGVYHKGVQNNTATPNAPSAIWGILQVYSANNGSQILQIYTERDLPRRTFMRLRSNSVWYGWEEYAKKSDIEKLKNNAEFTKVNITAAATTNLGLMWGFGASAMRKGNLVTLSLQRAIHDVRSTYEYDLMVETIPSGFRPMSEAHWVVVANTGKTVSGTSVIHIASNGGVRFTNAITGNRVWTGTITYITNDPYP